MANPGFLTFDQLLDEALSNPAAEAELARRYQRDAAILVVDFTSMVHRTEHEGIVYALALARAAENHMKHAVLQHDGEVVKQVADSFFAAFATPAQALAAALDGIAAMRDFNAPRTGTLDDGQRNDPIYPCVGLGYGPSLIIPGENLFGDEVNRAFVLGEDTARANEVLCSPAFLAALGTLPSGLGAHVAPADRQEAAGFPFHVVRDFREG